MARYLGLLLLALCLETPIVAQETRTLLPSGFGSQGTGGINVLFTPLDGQWILMVGGSGGVPIGHSLSAATDCWAGRYTTVQGNISPGITSDVSRRAEWKTVRISSRSVSRTRCTTR